MTPARRYACDLAERTVWTAVAAALAAVPAAAVLDVEAWQAAGTAALTAVLTLLLAVARARLAVLPDPGDGLPGLPTGGE